MDEEFCVLFAARYSSLGRRQPTSQTSHVFLDFINLRVSAGYCVTRN